MEEAFRLDRQMDNAPWRFSWQKNERNLVFDDHLKIQLIKGFAAKELGLSDEVSCSRAAPRSDEPASGSRGCLECCPRWIYFRLIDDVDKPKCA